MFESNTFRMIMLIGGVIVFALVVNFVMSHIPEIKLLINNIFSQRHQFINPSI